MVTIPPQELLCARHVADFVGVMTKSSFHHRPLLINKKTSPVDRIRNRYVCEGLVCSLLGRKRSVKLEMINKFKALPPFLLRLSLMWSRLA